MAQRINQLFYWTALKIHERCSPPINSNANPKRGYRYKMMKTQHFSTALLTLTLCACSAISQVSPSIETTLPTVEPTSTDRPLTPTMEPVNQDGAQTVLKFEFPFEPAPPGYLVDVKSNVFTANLMCAVENGEILNLDDNSTNSQSLGFCDTSSMTLNILIPDQVTVTVILGGFPLVNEVTKTPDLVTAQQAEYQFESSLK